MVSMDPADESSLALGVLAAVILRRAAIVRVDVRQENLAAWTGMDGTIHNEQRERQSPDVTYDIRVVSTSGEKPYDFPLEAALDAIGIRLLDLPGIDGTEAARGAFLERMMFYYGERLKKWEGKATAEQSQAISRG